MKDGLGNVQSALVFGGDSDIAIQTIKMLSISRLKQVILAGRDIERLEVRSVELRNQHNLEVRTIAFDALAFDQHEEIVREAFSSEQDIDLVLIAFGALGDQLVDETNRDAALALIQTNFTGAVSVLIPVIKQMKDQGHGTIVVMSSVAVERPRRSNFIYGASKAGLDWFSQGMQDALRGSGVNVCIIRPGFATTKMTSHLSTPPMASTPDEVASAIIRAIASNKEITWVPSRLRWVMSVLRHLPRTIFRRLNI